MCLSPRFGQHFELRSGAGARRRARGPGEGRGRTSNVDQTHEHQQVRQSADSAEAMLGGRVGDGLTRRHGTAAGLILPPGTPAWLSPQRRRQTTPQGRRRLSNTAMWQHPLRTRALLLWTCSAQSTKNYITSPHTSLSGRSHAAVTERGKET